MADRGEGSGVVDPYVEPRCMYVYSIHASVSHMGRLAAGRCRWLGMTTNIFIYIQDIEPVDF